MSGSILLVEDDAVTRKIIKSILPGFVVTEAGTLAAAHDAVKEGNFDLVLLDIHLPDGNGLDACREFKRDFP